MPKFFLGTGASHGLSRLLTLERVKKSGLARSSVKVSPDPDLEAFRGVVRSSKDRAKKIAGVSRQVVKKLAGV